MKPLFSPDALKLNAHAEIDRICAAIRKQVAVELKCRGVVLGLSGGIDSSVSAALSVRALGPERVLGLFLPELDSSPESLNLGRLLSEYLGIRTVLEDITPILRAVGCYQRRDDAIRTLIPEYTDEYKCKIALPSAGEQSGYALFSLIVQPPKGGETKVRLTADAYRGIVAATNFKQRVRKMMEYYYADRYGYAVVGTPNRLEYDLGFFVKNGDGAADLKPIAHLYKTQVYQLAAALNIPKEIQIRPPTTDTYSLEQSQEEFYFSLPLTKMDLCLYAKNHGIAPEEAAAAADLTLEQAAYVYRQIDSKRSATRYLRSPPLLVSGEETAKSAPRVA
ncbi:MAG TPA: NAD(+) synthase [Verrucomicrobiae bacterium]|jgi:NAD+ synthase|nr:NAD(+) synthase [Verrucomicrobiae bacterium]